MALQSILSVSSSQRSKWWPHHVRSERRIRFGTAWNPTRDRRTPVALSFSRRWSVGNQTTIDYLSNLLFHCLSDTQQFPHVEESCGFWARSFSFHTDRRSISRRIRTVPSDLFDSSVSHSLHSTVSQTSLSVDDTWTSVQYQCQESLVASVFLNGSDPTIVDRFESPRTRSSQCWTRRSTSNAAEHRRDHQSESSHGSLHFDPPSTRGDSEPSITHLLLLLFSRYPPVLIWPSIYVWSSTSSNAFVWKSCATPGARRSWTFSPSTL